MTVDQVLQGVRAITALLIGIILARFISRRLQRSQRFAPQQTLLIRRLSSTVILAVAFMWFLRELGFELGPLLGAAGIVTVAVGFASQTALSNVISGVFLIGEQPFVVGDFITVADRTGEVVSIDLMSVKLRTFDNLLVRVPNESMIKSNVTNLTHFPIRRMDLIVGVAYKEKLAHVEGVLMEVADANPLCLEEPPPRCIYTGFMDSSVSIQFSVWTAKDNFLDARNALYVEIKQALDEAGIEIPFPHRTVYAGSVTEPFPIRLVSDREHAEQASRKDSV